MVYLRSLLTLCTALLISMAASAADGPDFPRLAAINNGGPHNYDDSTYQAQLARYHVSMLGTWVGWESGKSMTFNEAVRRIKVINPNTKVFVYLNHNELQYPNTSVVKMDLRNILDQTSSWLYQSGGSGTMVKSTWGTDFYIANTTLYAPKDSSGRTWVESYARWAVDKLYNPNPLVDGFFLDNVFWRPRVNGDWNRDGTTDDKNNSTVQTWFRLGLKRHFDVMKQLMPGKYQIGNIADWGQAPGILPEFDQQLHGGLLENIIGPSYAAESWGGWSPMMQRYRRAMAAAAAPKLIMFQQWGSPTDYQGLRYGLGSCLLDDGYFTFASWSGGTSFAPYREVVWFDEFNAKLGKATSSPSTSAWSQGVYRRDFENGIVLVNPKGNGPRTVQLETEFKRLQGSQAPSVNSGQLTSSVTLKDRDGIILLRKQAVKLPMPPDSVIVQ